jgi:DNA-binding CsgD family transcriptional regulator
MDYLSSAQFAHFNDAVAEIYSATRPGELVQAVLTHLPRLVAVESSTFFPVGTDHWHFTDVVSQELDPALFAQYIAHYEPHDLYKRVVFATTPLPIVDRSSDFMDYREWARNEHRADFLLPNGLYHLAGIQLIIDDLLIGDFSFHRGRGPDFTEVDLLIMGAFQRHLSLAFAACLARLQAGSTPVLRATCPLLSAREQEIAYLVAVGLSNDAIAVRLDISRNTVKTHLKHLMGKTGGKNRAELTYALFRWVGSPVAPLAGHGGRLG